MGLYGDPRCTGAERSTGFSVLFRCTVPQGEKVALFNENDLLEIAMNRAATKGTGGADKLFGLHIGDMIRIEFTPQGSHKNFDTLF